MLCEIRTNPNAMPNKKNTNTQALASPASACALAHSLPLEAALAPILVAQRTALSGLDPAEYPRAPVEIILVCLTLVAQLALGLNTHGYLGCAAPPEAAAATMTAAGASRGGARSGDDTGQSKLSARGCRRVGRRWRKDVARGARLRAFLGEQVGVAAEVKLCVGHAACRAESKDLARRAASLISLLQVREKSGGLMVGYLQVRGRDMHGAVSLSGVFLSLLHFHFSLQFSFSSSLNFVFVFDFVFFSV